MQDLIKSINIVALVETRNTITSNIEKAHVLLKEASDLSESINATQSLDYLQKLHIRRFCKTNGENTNLVETATHAVRHVDAKLWDLLLRESGVASHMDKASKDKWRRELKGEAIPELTPENIASTFTNLLNSRGDMFADGVVNIFKLLSWDYKTNLPHKFGKRIVIDRGICTMFREDRLSIDSDAIDKVADLSRVFYVADGKPEPDHRAMRRRDFAPGEKTKINDYLEIKAHRKGTLHVHFLRPDLVDALNKLVADEYPNALPPKR